MFCTIMVESSWHGSELVKSGDLGERLVVVTYIPTPSYALAGSGTPAEAWPAVSEENGRKCPDR